MRVFPDTNVLASAFGTRGLCADVLRLIPEQHELLIGEMVIEELRRVLKTKFRIPAETVGEIESFLGSYRVEPKPRNLPILNLSDYNDVIVIACAIQAKAEVLITGDQEMLRLKGGAEPLRIVSPREFWNLIVNRRK